MAKIETLKPRWLKDPEFRQAYDALENEFAIARELMRVRVRAGLTQAELARQMKTTQSAIARVESGKEFSVLEHARPLLRGDWRENNGCTRTEEKAGTPNRCGENLEADLA